jgi:hypothetical protein
MTMPKTRAKAPTSAKLSFVDAHGGALACLAAGVARAAGATDRLAATSSPAVSVPAEIGAVLAESGASAPPVVLASALPAGVEHIDVGAWGLVLHEGEGDLERLALARIARDRIERRLSADGAR